jgi:hypothetical protein
MLYTDAVLAAAWVAEQTRKPQFVVGRDEQWAVGNHRVKPIEGFTVHKVVPRPSKATRGRQSRDADGIALKRPFSM